MSSTEDLAKLEALLFVAGDPVSVGQLAELLELEEGEVRALLEQLKRRYQRDPMSGLILREVEDAAALATSPEL
ncbi:MAG: SMC-Scp complex subunit ScpB, partial [Saccharofermentanales bacterium]